MLLSMTGFGEARRQPDGMSVGVEIRTINNRYVKFSIRSTEGYNVLDQRVESVVREKIRRGTIQVNIRVERKKEVEDYLINADLLTAYLRQLSELEERSGSGGCVSIESLLTLPGVVVEGSSREVDAEADWPVICDTLNVALENLQKMRAEEGRKMEADLRSNCRSAKEGLEVVEKRAPIVVEAYRERLRERLEKTLSEFDVSLDAADIIREVALFGERSDISEEIVRLRSHLDQFESFIDSPEGSGRKLDFLTQEMFREANTIGSKANDVDIARHVIEIKSSIERIREMVQNVE